MNPKRQQVINHLNSKLPPTILVQPTESQTNEYLELIGEKKTITLIVLFPDETGCYMKVPQKWIPDPIGYLTELSRKNYYFLLVKDDRYSMPIAMTHAMKFWHPRMSTTKLNENRLQFYGESSKINYSEVTMVDMFGGSVIQSLIDLVQ